MTPAEKIDTIKKNLFYRSVDAIEDYHKFDWHSDAAKLNSSQALTIDFWGCLKQSKFKNQLINILFNKNEQNWEIEFEYVDKKLLSEKKSTQIDILIKGVNTALILESKFTEKDGGGCSQVNRLKNNNLQCNGNYELQINPNNNIQSRCALTGKGIKYWKYIERTTHFIIDNDYSPCPFKKGEYQWMRNISFASAYSIEYKIKVETYLVYLDSAKCSISKKVSKGTYLGELKGKIKDSYSFMPISYNSLISRCIKYLEREENERKIWMDLEQWILMKESATK